MLAAAAAAAFPLSDGVVAYPVLQAYGSLALKDISEAGGMVLDKCSISCICTSTFILPARAKECNRSFLLGEDLVIFPTCEVGQLEGPISKGPGMGYLFLTPTSGP